MTLHADHIAGVVFVALGIAVFGLSGDLPTGQLSMPGSGFFPKIVATLVIAFGLLLVARARESIPFSNLSWSDGIHACLVTLIAIAAIALYPFLGFVITMLLLLIGLLVVVERRNLLYAVGYSVLVVMITYISFEFLLKTRLPRSPFGY